ncbi:MAG: sugar phosphate isomerase/epimerase [Planctomycetaceae bacterium]|nr:sugar phosphate isomerase/epimerase [Planctomycetaceae bacterium]
MVSVSDSVSRRKFLVRASAVAATVGVVPTFDGGSIAASAETSVKRKFTLDLQCGSIGVAADQRRAMALAGKFGFESLTPVAGYLAELSDSQRAELLAELKEKELVWGAAGLSVDFRSDETAFRDGLKRLPAEARALQQTGATRVGTWLRPFHDSLTYVQNFRQHATRLRECCRILGDHGLRFGMEYVGPRTLWASTRHSFIHSMAETKDLIAEIGLDNVGFVLDSWHWYTAHETADDLKTLSNKDIVACDLNDAPGGIAVDEQIDSRRELPAATGVIDLKTFLTTLAEIGYDGPVRAEPFNAALNAMDDDAAVEATATAMKKAFAVVG